MTVIEKFSLIYFRARIPTKPACNERGAKGHVRKCKLFWEATDLASCVVELKPPAV